MKSASTIISSALLAGQLLTGSGCGTPTNQDHPTEAPAPKGPITHEGLKALQASGVRFIREDGKEADLSDIQKEIGNHYSTLSYMFGVCPVECPRSVKVLKQVSEKDPNIVNIVVATQPGDFGSPDEPGVLRMMVNNNYGEATAAPRSILLFPTATGSAEDLNRWKRNVYPGSKDAGVDSFKRKVVDAQIATGVLPPNSTEPGTHSVVLQLYSPAGKKLGEAMNNDSVQIKENLLDKIVPIPAVKGAAITR